ncbi:MAG TPA: 16S rRNA (cytosine(1402)-N(4))-methyltransferase RsmH [Terriglobales bacterium]|nr:16S rRNA (cytosine(1402)-N(4))-methyltransferase RsmH [Terriglobales bacterium]
MEFLHVPVMIQEMLDFLNPRPGKRYLDGTLGGGTYADQILVHSGPDGSLLGLDRDEEAIAATEARLGGYGNRLTIRQASFAQAREILRDLNWHQVDGAVLDLGVSSHQVDYPQRGFSFRSSARLDMRMDRRQSLDAYEIVNTYSEAQIEGILRKYGEERQARRIARAIVTARRARPIETTTELAQSIVRVKGKKGDGHHPATQTFQALRMAVNQELESLERFLAEGYELLRPEGRMVIISFHSLEDRLVKNAFRKWSQTCLCPPRVLRCRCGWSQKVRVLTKKPVRPAPAELQSNPRSRSARLRAVVRI